MNLRIIKAGILDTVQDPGRFGHQHTGINPGGAMDTWSAQIANILAGNPPKNAVIELHFPASEFFFEDAALIAVCGGDLSAHINGEEIPLGQPVMVNRFSILQFYALRQGARAYLAIHGSLNLTPWLNSYSTNLKAACGGFKGRALQKDDEINISPLPNALRTFLGKAEFDILPWKAENSGDMMNDRPILVLEGNEWQGIAPASKIFFPTSIYSISPRSDRMGYTLNGDKLLNTSEEEMISSSVNFGTIQLLPDGQLIILMADHQTTGGYPRIAHVISAHLPVLAQRKPGDKLQFNFTDLATAESMFVKQQQHLLQLQNACKFRLEKYLNEN